ncbi:plasmid stabilization protein [Thiocystis minor]|uniref:type II toxin-antitoxin system RelE/ParE family toxin n=1 Tax=Thiocystis minor TaxID=61597 RepID=UPI0019126683|nr:type II toxin-antitoxin system RelE/ParE family toxin [Thiocystis minor]MBK5965576.1 plasmid stabilization protein [Thiocystis minor]
MSEVIWLPEAIDDLERLRAFLLDKHPEATRKAAQVVLKGADLLSDFPEIGQPMDDGTGRRELFEAFGRGEYVLRYRIEGGAVVILRVWHAKEQRETH